MIFPIALIILFNYLRVINIFGYRIILLYKNFLMTSNVNYTSLKHFFNIKNFKKKISRLVRRKIFVYVKKNKVISNLFRSIKDVNF